MEQGSNHVVDQTYTHVIRPYEAAYPLSNPNPHEFYLTAGGKTFVQAVYEIRPLNLTDYAGPEHGFVEDGCFQEIDASNGNAIFSWCGLDHLPVWHTKIFLRIPGNVANWTGEPYGEGTAELPWDYFHINSIDKTHEGDYIISARHLDQVLKIAGNDNVHGVTPGTILWRLGGKYNEFSSPHIADLSRQHHVRILSTTRTETTFTMFNNQWQHDDNYRDLSNVQIITINNETMSVTRSQRWYQPEGYKSFAQGSMQLLPNGNVLVGWGTVPHLSEFLPNGTLLYHMHLDTVFEEERGTRNMQNYRVFKAQWTAKPKTKPKLVAYSRLCTTSEAVPFVAYVSWNGATEVRSWRFYRRSLWGVGPWVSIGKFAKQGFETKVYFRNFWGSVASLAKEVKVVGLDKNDRTLGSTTTLTFVPGQDARDNCTAEGCFATDWYEYDRAQSRGEDCESDAVGFLLFAVVFVAVAIAVVRFWVRRRPKSRSLSTSK